VTSVVKISVPFLAVALLATSACRRDARNENSDTSPPAPPFLAPVPAPSTTSTTDHAEVFRRAFWRQPSTADHILQADRRVDPDDGSWQWFIQLHPSPELLAALRDPENLGLLPTTSPRALSDAGDIPDWFSPAALPIDFEILQSPATALTVLYRAADNTLFATDHGPAFAAPVR
jgi:hypothetical protein